MSVPGVSMLMGAGALEPAPADVLDALHHVEIVTTVGERGSFALRFHLGGDSSTLPERFLPESGDLVRIVLSTGTVNNAVAMDGVPVEHTISTGSQGAPPTLSVAGEDLTLLMDLIDASGRPFSAMAVQARVQLILSAYAPFGVTPLVVAPPIEEIPTPAQRMPQQQGTDYAYLRMLADWVVPGASGPRRDHERTSPPGVRAGSRRARRQGCGETIMSGEQSRYFGKYRGTVVNTVDPERRARLQATVPDVLGAEPSTWAMPSAPFAGSGAGFVAIPPVGAGVWIEFEQGNPDYPIWSGCWWGVGNELPTIVAASAQPGIGQVAIVTAGRNSLVISDLPGPTGGIALRTTTGAHISVTSTGIIIDNGQGAAITLSGNTVHIAGVRI